MSGPDDNSSDSKPAGKRGRGRPRAKDPRKHHVPFRANDYELHGLEMGANAIQVRKRPGEPPAPLPLGVYLRVMGLYGRVRPMDLVRALRRDGYEVVSGPGVHRSKRQPTPAPPPENEEQRRLGLEEDSDSD